jgi:SpoVK/Ycf46/Vps4 family AAA+-type ATPase
MNDNLKGLLYAVADNDLQKAKSYCKAILSTETAQCNKYIVNNIFAKLNTSSMNMLELPHNVKGLLMVEDVPNTFNEARYVLSNADSEVVDKILNIWHVNDKLLEYGIRYLNSTLLYGESGCGKTMLGRYIAYKIGLPFAYLNFSRIVASYLGETGRNIAMAFDYIKTIRCVFMMDEIDAIGLIRGTETISEMSRVVINLMQCLDRLDTGTIVIGATNREDTLDTALKRRFSLQHKMNLPSKEIRRTIAEKYISTIPNAIYKCQDFEEFAISTEGMSHAKITTIIIDRIVECLTKNEPVSLRERGKLLANKI